jgi:PilZ domain
MLNRRSSHRNLCSDIVKLSWNDELGWPARTHAVIEDISGNGACLQCEISIPVGSAITLQLNDSGFEALVRYCTLIDHGYFVGVEFVQTSRWTPDGAVRPKHLLEPLEQVS